MSQQSRSFIERRRRRAIIGIISLALALASWIFVFSRLSFLPSMAIVDIKVYGADPDLAPIMTAAAGRAMGGSYLGIFSRSNAFIYPKGEISDLIVSSSPRVHDVEVRRNGLQTLAITVSQKIPAAIICADLPDLGDDGLNPSDNCYAVDTTGLIFRRQNASDQDNYNRFYIPDLAGQELLGTHATPTDRFSMWQSLIISLKSAGINVRGMLIRDGHDYELYADNPIPQNRAEPSGTSTVVIQMDERAGLDIEKENLIAFWNRMLIEARTKKMRLEWSEIKLQYPPNVYSR